jgi:3-oxoadipate enol-lactonase
VAVVAPVLTHRVDGAAGRPTVLLLNGGMMSIAAWNDVATALAPAHRVVRCDFRGQLLTPELPPPDLAAHVDDVVALLDRLGIDALHVAGTSFGGEVGLLLAARHPERVRSLVAATVVDVAPEAMRIVGERLISLCRHAVASGASRPFFDAMSEIIYSPAFRERMGGELSDRYDSLATLPASWFAGGALLLEAVDRMDLRDELAAIRCPTTVVAAELDALMPTECTVAVAEGIPGARLELVPGSGHALVVEEKDVFIRLVVETVRRATADPGGVLRSP